MKKTVFLLLAVLLLTACGYAVETEQEALYMNITAQEAKQIMDSGEACIILDVRTREEYDQGHIPGARCFPLDDIACSAEVYIPDKQMQYLIYCRSGRRSKQAAQILAELGYTDIKEFGGILDWSYETE